MDRKIIDKHLRSIRAEANVARHSTGMEFDATLEAIENDIASIRREQRRSERDALLTELWTALILPFDEAFPIIKRYVNADTQLLFDERIARWCADNADAVAAWEKANRNPKGN